MKKCIFVMMILMGTLCFPLGVKTQIKEISQVEGVTHTENKDQSMHVFWQIGQKDNSWAEFALGGNLTMFTQRFGNEPIVYEIGKSNPKTDFPYIFPGSRDAWAGNFPHQIIIRFGIKELSTPCSANLELNFLRTHPSSSLVEVYINDCKLKTQSTPQAPSGHIIPGYCTLEYSIPENVLKKGNNFISIISSGGGWIEFDNLSLSTIYPLKPDRITGNIDNTININIVTGEAKQALIYDKNRALRQRAIIQVTNWGKEQSADVLVNGKFLEKVFLNPGINRIETSVPEVKQETDMEIALAVKSKEMSKYRVKASPVRNWTLYLVQHTHTDIGYTKLQSEILTEHFRNIDNAIEYCELTENYPDDAKFRWTCETSWSVKEYLQSRTEEQINKLIKYIKAGQLEVTGMFFSMSEIIDENSFKTFLEPVREFKKLGIPVTTAMQNDVNGIAWCLADYMSDIGIKYFTIGENDVRALKPFKRPTVFKWESPAGKKAYVYRNDHYMHGNTFFNSAETEIVDDQIFSYLDGIEKRDYPFDAVSVSYLGYLSDNGPPSMRQSALIRDWNNKYATPKIRNALFHEFMDYITGKYDDELPVYRVAYPDWWTDGFGSAARETAAARKAHADMITIQGMLSMAVLKDKVLSPSIADKIRHIHESLLFYDEHTFGASESIRDPKSYSSEVQWSQKSSYAWEAFKSAKVLYETSAGLLQTGINRGEFPTVTIYNTLNWTRSGITEVHIDNEIIPSNRSFKIIDETGKELQTQYLRTSVSGVFYMIYAENLPPLGYKTYRIIAEKDDRPPLSSASLNENSIENEYFKMIFDTQTGGIKSLFDKKLQLEMVDPDSDWQLGVLVYETLLGNRWQMLYRTLEEYNRNGMTDVRIRKGVNGAIYQSVMIEGKSGCCDDGFGVKIEIRLFHHEKLIELHYAARKTPIIDPDGIYVAFPFKLDNARLYFDVQGGIVSSGENQLEGTASDWNMVQNFVTARNDKAQFIVGSDQAPLFQLGGIRTGFYQYQKSYELPHVYSFVTNNYWYTNFRASQEGELRWSYYLTSDSDLSNTAATRFGWGSRVPIYARVMPKGKANNLPMGYSSFSFDRDNLLMTSATPSIDQGYVLINVRELDGKQTPFQITDSTGKILEFSIVNILEEPIQSRLKETRFEPFENKFIKINK